MRVWGLVAAMGAMAASYEPAPSEFDPRPEPGSSGPGSLDPLGDRARLDAAEAKRARRRARNLRNAGGAR